MASTQSDDDESDGYGEHPENDEGSWSTCLDEDDVQKDEDPGAAGCLHCRKRRYHTYTKGMQEWHFCEKHGDHDAFVQFLPPVAVPGTRKKQPVAPEKKKKVSAATKSADKDKELTILSLEEQLRQAHHMDNVYVLYADGTLNLQKHGDGGGNSERFIALAITPNREHIVHKMPIMDGRDRARVSSSMGWHLRGLMKRLYGLGSDQTDDDYGQKCLDRQSARLAADPAVQKRLAELAELAAKQQPATPPPKKRKASS